uniref:Uncharacterized protein n=1 Tax=Anopheles minimus TaxID=112268 RepID=A0A182WM81_9DIPT
MKDLVLPTCKIQRTGRCR